jgi:hypothetical protein
MDAPDANEAVVQVICLASFKGCMLHPAML